MHAQILSEGTSIRNVVKIWKYNHDERQKKLIRIATKKSLSRLDESSNREDRQSSAAGSGPAAGFNRLALT
jgi:hypothetical protein